jgi:SNF2 family DNA or RNA helicase
LAVCAQIVQAIVKFEGFRSERLDGSVKKSSDRQAIVQRFNDDPTILGASCCASASASSGWLLHHCLRC